MSAHLPTAWTPFLWMAFLLAFPACGDSTPSSGTTPDATIDAPRDAGNEDVISSDTLHDDTHVEDVSTPCNGAKSCVDENGLNSPALCADQPDTLCEEGCCVPLFKCQEDADCTRFSGLAGQGDIANCEDERFTCACDLSDGSCYLFVCNTASDCGTGEFCANGICAPLPAQEDLQVRILTRHAVLSSGASQTLHVAVFHPEDPGALIPDVPVEWEVADTTIASMNGNTLESGDVAGTTTVSARVVGGALWSAPIGATNTGEPPQDTFRVVVVDGHSGGLVESSIHIHVQGPPGEEASSFQGNQGIADFPDSLLPADVHVYVDDHHHLSVYGWTEPELLLAPPPRFEVELHVDPDGTLDPTSQTFSGPGEVLHGVPNLEHYTKPGEIEAAITSLSLGDGLLGFNLPQLLGPNVSRYWDPEAPPGLFDSEEEQELPGGVTFSVGFPVVTDYWLAAAPGDTTMWSLGGRVGLGDAGVGQKISQIIASISGGDNIDIQEIISTLLPLFQDFYSGVKVVDVGDSPDFETPNETDVTLMLPLTNRITMALPALPMLTGPDSWPETVLVLGGSMDETGQFTPLGITAGTDAEVTGAELDGIVDGDPSTPEQDPFTLSMAGAHSGIQTAGSQHALIAFASALDDSDPERPEAGSGMVTRFTLPDAGPSQWAEAQDVPESFLSIPSGSTFNAEGLRALSIPPIEGADLQRVIVEGAQGNPSWHVYLPPNQDSVLLPIPADGLPDPAATSSQFLVNAFDLRDGVTWKSLFTSGDVSSQQLLGSVTRVSYIREKQTAP